MSLLLDALKKAAEQKAEKSKREIAESRTSDETLIGGAGEDISVLEESADSSLQQAERRLQDETELDNSELETRLERTRVEAEHGDDTGLDVPDSTETGAVQPSSQMQTGEDETIVFSDDDVSDFLVGQDSAREARRAADDETDLSQLGTGEDRTGLGEKAAAGATAARQDDTDISQPFDPGEQTDFRKQIDTGEETDLSQLASADETGLDEQADSYDDTGPGVAAEAGEETDISIPPPTVAELERVEAERAVAEQEGVVDDDMSLLLVDRDQTNLTSPTSATDPRTPDQLRELQSTPGGDDGLALVDTTRHQLPDEQTETGETTAGATTGIAPDTQTGGITTATETSTRTYAPDNYDRTLMRLPSDDASKLFAGMKSDSDVVMTPEYAKKVFRSKSSAQRMQHYKFYGGIAIVILLAIGVYGTFEFTRESEYIDTSLRPLKRDPMPGIIQSGGAESTTDLFAQTEVDERTLELVQNATNADQPELVGEGVIAEQGASAEQTASAEPAETTAAASASAVEPEPSVAVESTAAVTQSVDTVTPAVREAAANVEVASAAPPRAAVSQRASGSGSLQISSDTRIEEKQMWLREAYDAYAAGDDELALSLYNKVLKLDPSNRNALLARAAINIQNNNSPAAIRDYQALLLANPKDSLAMASLLSIASYSPRETESQLKLLIRDEPDSPHLNFALANIYGAQNRWKEAQGHYFKALQNNPDEPNYAYNLAVSLEHIAQPRAAMSYYQLALDNFENGLATFSRDVVDQRMETLANP